MTDKSFSSSVEVERDVRFGSFPAAFVKLPTVNIKCFNCINAGRRGRGAMLQSLVFPKYLQNPVCNGSKFLSG